MRDRLRVAVLVDLSREAASGGHVKYWERVAQAAARQDSPIDMTVYFSGARSDENLSPYIRYRCLPPVFSTGRLKFLPYVPAHTDLAGYHKELAAQLSSYDVIHTTDGCFAFARTAERVAREKNIPLVTSFHTDTPAYSEIFTRQTLYHLLGRSLGDFFVKYVNIPAIERRQKQKRLETHLRACCIALVMRKEDRDLMRMAAPQAEIRTMRLGVDKEMFTPEKADRTGILRRYNIPDGRFLALFVGRVDAGKNARVMADACRRVAAANPQFHMIVAGLGPHAEEVKDKLGDHVTMAGWVDAPDLARLYASVDCLTVLSDVEIGGMIGLEALASGCPALVSRQSEMAQICGQPRAMHMVDSGVDNWTTALGAYVTDKEQQRVMRLAALDFRRDNLASWGDVLEQDFIPAWVAAAQKFQK